MKLIKINTDHYVVVDDSEIKEGDYFLSGNNNILHYAKGYTPEDTNDRGLNCKKITHSTQKLYKNDFWAIQELKLSEVKELIGEKSWKGYIDGTEWEVEIVDGKLKLV